MLNVNTAFELCQKVDIPTIGKFSWESTFTKLEENAPLLLTTLKSIVCRKASENTLDRPKGNLKPKVGTAVACLLHARAPKTAIFLPKLFSIQFWRGGLKRETINQMAHTGICLGNDATLAAVDKIRVEFDLAAKNCKSLIEDQVRNVTEETTIVSDEDDLELSRAMATSEVNIEDEFNGPSDEETILYSDDEGTPAKKSHTTSDDESDTEQTEELESEDDNEEEEDDEQEDDEDPGEELDDFDDESLIEAPHISGDEESMEVEEEKENLSIPHDETIVHHPGFTLCWDNVGKKVMTRHPTPTTSNTYMNMALGYMAVNRVSSADRVWDTTDELIKANDIPVDSFVPNDIDFGRLRDRMEVVVGRIIVRHLSWFKVNFEAFSVPHILHQHSNEASKRSIIINLGVFDENPSSTAGAIGIYEKLQKYIPSIQDKPYTSIVYGDGLSCERGNDAHRARSNGLNPWERLEGLEPSPQEFHKEMILLQDFFDEFFKNSSASDRGTICQLKNLFNFRTVKADISDNFTHAWELMCLLTEGFVCLLTMKLLEMETPENRPSKAPLDLETASPAEKQAYFQELCKSVVKKVWHELDTKQLKVDNDSGQPLYCCGEELDEGLIGCEERANCPYGELFHFSCVGVDPNNLPDLWYCSDDCRNRKSFYRYCHCHEDLGPEEPMIGCAAAEKCSGPEWYHMKCVNVTHDSVGDEDWFCQEPCRQSVKGKRKKSPRTGKASQVDVCDYVYNYSRALVWSELNLLCRRDAVREGDGDAMMSHWKLDLIQFFARGHPKYVILAHRLIASLKGWVSEKLQHELTWNRTVNYGGGIGRNLPMDLMNEILNRLFKDTLDAAKGRYTENTLQRCSQIIGPLGESLDTVFDAKVIENEIYRHRRRAQNRDQNVAKLISFLQPSELFSLTCGRFHKAFPYFHHRGAPKFPGKFPGKMKQLSKRLDKRRAAVINN